MKHGNGFMRVDTQEHSHGIANHAQASSLVAVEDLTQTDTDTLIYMYQEEKLAMDVYDSLEDQYDLAIFDKISDAEQVHLSTIESVLVNNGVDISDLQNLDAGEFANEELQSLYNTLIEQGSTSLEDALNVGVTIENQDIADLQEYIDSSDTNVALVGVFSHLETGSEHHLAAFSQALDDSALLA